MPARAHPPRPSAAAKARVRVVVPRPARAAGPIERLPRIAPTSRIPPQFSRAACRRLNGPDQPFCMGRVAFTPPVHQPLRSTPTFLGDHGDRSRPTARVIIKRSSPRLVAKGPARPAEAWSRLHRVLEILYVSSVSTARDALCRDYDECSTQSQYGFAESH